MRAKSGKPSAAARLGAQATIGRDRSLNEISVSAKRPASTQSEAPPSKPSNSAASLVAAQARRQLQSNSNIVNLAGERLKHTRIEKGADECTGKPFLGVRFPQRNRPDQVVDLSFLLALPNLADALAEGFRLWGASMLPRTRVAKAGEVRRGFAAYFAQHRPSLTFEDLDTALLTGFLQWLDSKAASVRGKVLLPSVRQDVLCAPKLLLTALLAHPHWANDARKVLEEYPVNPYPGAETKSTPRKRLLRGVLEAIDEAAQLEANEIQQRLEEGRRLLAEGQKRIADGDNDYNNIAVALAAMAARYPDVLPSNKRLRDEAPELFNAIYSSRNGHGIAKLGSYIYASSRDLVPFVLLLAIETAFNVDTMLALDWAGITEVDRLGTASIRVTGPKARAAKDPVKYLDPKRVGPWLTTLRQLTERLRPLLHPADRNRVFVFAQSRGAERGAKPFEHDQSGPSADVCWKCSLRSFAKQHSLPSFNLSQIRPTMGDEIGLRQDSLIARQALDHRSFATTEASYLGSGTRDREAEHLNTAVQQMERWIRTDGRIDTRRVRLTPTMDKGAATPGYACADPYDSPRIGQKKGRLCAGYGECPACPLAGADNTDPIAVAYYVALRNAIYVGQERMAPQAWFSRWAPVLVNIQAQLAHVQPEVLAKSAQFPVSLPPVG